jgi:hypothetical protein
MAYALAADVAMLVHFVFLLYVAMGGFLAWRKPGLIVPHVAAAAWGLLSATVGMDCPLTAWEDAARRHAGEQGLPHGFIGTYLTGVIYPADRLVEAQLLVASVVLVSWIGFAVRLRRRPAGKAG